MMIYNYSIEEIKEETGAEYTGSYYCGLSSNSWVDKIKEEISQFTATIKTGFKSMIGSLKKSKIAKNMAIYGLAGAMALSAAACSKNITPESSKTPNSIVTEIDNNKDTGIPADSLFSLLLNKSKSETQKKVISSVGNYLSDFNIRFANKVADDVTYKDRETGKERTITIKPALTWDEAMAMSLVYNDFSKDKLVEILNGAEIDANDLTNSYKMAILQLMGAHVLETTDNQVNIDMLLQNKQAKDFYAKYHKMFLECKSTTGDARLKAVENFYNELYKDFPITSEVREEGIAHSDPRASIEPYKFSIVPMVAASEMIFQNLEIDHTFTQQAIDYINDIGACNIADDILEKAELVSLSTQFNEDYADYEKVRKALIAYLTDKDAYVIDDEHRNLSDLPAFQEIVNGFILEPFSYTYVTTHTVTYTYTTTEKIETSDRDEAVDIAGEDAVKEAEDEAQEELDKENEAAKDEAEKEADEIADEIQKEEDEKREDLEDKVDQSDEDYQDEINDANDKIDNGGTVNEGDLGHGTDFDNEHSKPNGDLDDSVSDITTDGSGAVDSSEPLPDPNAESYEFESITDWSVEPSKASEIVENNAYDFTIEPVEEAQNSTTQINEYKEPEAFTSEEEIDAWIEYLAANARNSNEQTNSYHM